MSNARDKEIEMLARLAEEELRRQGLDHPPAERLTAYRAGMLPDREADALREHLALCPECTRALLALPRFSREAEKRIVHPPLLLLPPSWRPALRKRVPARLLASLHWVFDDRRVQSGAAPGGVERRILVPVMVYTLAVGLVGCFAGIPIGYASHPQKPPQAVVAQMIGGETFRSAEPEKPLELAPSGPAGGARTLVWQLPEGSDPRATYRVEIQDRAGTTLLAAETRPTALAAPPHPSAGSADPPRNVAVEIPLEQLAPGDYRLVLSGPPGEEPAEQLLRVLAPPARV